MLEPLSIVQELDFERVAGSAGEKQAAEIVCQKLTSWGLNPLLEKFPVKSFSAGSAELLSKSGVFKLTPFGLESGKEIDGELLYIENPEQMRFCQGEYSGKIIISYGFARNLADVLKANKIAGFISIGSVFKEAVSLSHRQHAENPVPAFTVDYDDGCKVRELSGQKVKITVKQQVYDSQATNIIVDLPGLQSDNNLTYLVGHYDTVARSKGACDNAGGVACMLKIVEQLVQNPVKRDLRIIFFSGEELGLLGSQYYAQTHSEELHNRGKLLINIDVSGDDTGSDQHWIMGSRELLGYVDALSKEIGILFKNQLEIYSSDGIPFSVYEIPSVNIARYGGKASFHGHTSQDKVGYISARGLENSWKSGLNLINRVLNAAIYPVQKELDESLREKIEKYIWNMTGKEPVLFWQKKYQK